jgi:serine/threonine protein kinase/Tol biopolymer transport system component
MSAIGTKLGPYEIVNEIGSGGMGEVYRARDPRIGRDVAIKLISSNVVTTKEKLHRFEQEARATGALNHPNILHVYDVGASDGSPYVVTELLEGETLRKRIASGSIPVRKVIDYAIQIAHGLTAAHAKGIVHRDLKPENIFITKDGRVKILDFGLAKLTHPEISRSNSDEHETVSRITDEGIIVGTVAYMSPEQIRGSFIDHRSDIFAFGIILYEMLSGKRPFAGQSNIETMNAIIEKEAPEISNPEISPAFGRIVHRCLEKDADRRFQSTSDLAFALEALSGSTSGSVRLQDEKPTRIKQKTWMIALAAILFGALATYVFTKTNAKQAAVSEKAPFKIHQLTIGNGYVGNARFGPDGHSVFYSASWNGNPVETFFMRIGDRDARSLGFKDTDLRSVSSKTELAIDLKTSTVDHALARVPFAGGSPRVLLGGHRYADWSPDGNNLAVMRWARIEYPIGKLLYRTDARMHYLRFSPDGKYLAFFEANEPYGSIIIMDQNGNRKKLGPPMFWNYVTGLAWSPSGKEIWFGKPSADSNTFVISSIDLSGKVREILPMNGWFEILDIFKDGRILLLQGYRRSGLIWGSTKESKEKNISFLDGSESWDITNDGKTVLIQQNTDAAIVPVPSIYLRKIDEPDAVYLGEGHAIGFSPDDQWVLAWSGETKSGPKNSILLFPVSMGEPKIITPDLQDAKPILWFPDGKRILIEAIIKGGKKQNRELDRALFAFNIETKKSEQITPAGYYTSGSVNGISPDARFLVAASVEKEDRWYLYSFNEKKLIDLPGVDIGDHSMQWSSDGSYLYYQIVGEVPAKVYRTNLTTGKKQLWKTVIPSDPAGVKNIWFSMTPDGNHYAYSYWRDLRQLIMIEGLK